MRWKIFLVFRVVLTVISVSNIRDVWSVSSLHIGPDLLLIFLVFFALNCDRQDAIPVSFAIGFAADVSSVAMLMGPYSISYCLLGGMISLFRKQVVMKKFIYQSMMIFFAGVIGGILTELLVSVKLGAMCPNAYSAVLLTALYSALIGPVIWKLFSKPLNLFFAEKPNIYPLG